MWRCDLDLWPLTLDICSVSTVTWWNSVPHLNAIEQSTAKLLRFQWPNDIAHVLSVALGSEVIFTKFDLRQLIRAWIIAFLCWYDMSHCDLDLWNFDIELLQHFELHTFKLCSTKFERNGIIHRWVIDDLARFRLQFSGWGTTDNFLSVRGPNFTKLGKDIGRDHHSIALLFQISDTLLHFQTSAAQSWVMF